MEFKGLIIRHKFDKLEAFIRVSCFKAPISNEPRCLSIKSSVDKGDSLISSQKIIKGVWFHKNLKLKKEDNIVADPGFPRGKREPQPQHTIWPFFPENCMKMKKFWPAVRSSRPLDPPLQQCIFEVDIFYSQRQ